MIVNNTPVEPYVIDGTEVLVKREDLCCPYPGPSFSKIRGVVAHIKNRPESTIGVLDTFHSKAGWAVSYVCKMLGGKQVIDFWPMYKGLGYVLQPQQLEAEKLGAQTVHLTAGRSAILFHQAKKQLRGFASEGETYMMPNALKLPESVTENAKEAFLTAGKMTEIGTLVISISSGTVAAGVIKGVLETGLLPKKIILHMGYSRSQPAVLEYLRACTGLYLSKEMVEFVDEGYNYADQAKGVVAPFPCNPFYDLKAWKWLLGRAEELPQPILFWNIGD